LARHQRALAAPYNRKAALGQREKIRRLYRPSELRLLFVGEAPPASGRFFYQRNSGLYRAMRDAFRALDPSISDDNFLSVFRNSGCYLIDVCPYPVDQLDAQSRRHACLASEPLLSRRIRQLRPQAIAAVMKSLRENVGRAALHAGWQG
jgi:uracil-DNA glycosylase